MVRVVFRVDASTKVGTDHFVRCLTMADALKKTDEQFRFVSHHLLKG